MVPIDVLTQLTVDLDMNWTRMVSFVLVSGIVRNKAQNCLISFEVCFVIK